MNSNKIEYQGGAFIVTGPGDIEEIRPGVRGVPVRADSPNAAQEMNSRQTYLIEELGKRLESIEAALIQREATLAKGMNVFAERVISVLAEAWGKALEEQEKRYISEISLTLWKIFEEQEAERQKSCERQLQLLLENLALQRGKNEPERQPSWWARVFENKEQT